MFRQVPTSLVANLTRPSLATVLQHKLPQPRELTPSYEATMSFGTGFGGAAAVPSTTAAGPSFRTTTTGPFGGSGATLPSSSGPWAMGRAGNAGNTVPILNSNQQAESKLNVLRPASEAPLLVIDNAVKPGPKFTADSSIWQIWSCNGHIPCRPQGGARTVHDPRDTGQEGVGVCRGNLPQWLERGRGTDDPPP